MPNARSVLCSAFLVVGFTAPASADSFINGNELYDECLKPSPTFCHAYVMAVAEVIGKQTDAMKDDGIMICMPDGTNTRQLMDVVVVDLRNDPANRTMPAHYIVMNALIKAWRCQK